MTTPIAAIWITYIIGYVTHSACVGQPDALKQMCHATCYSRRKKEHSTRCYFFGVKLPTDFLPYEQQIMPTNKLANFAKHSVTYYYDKCSRHRLVYMSDSVPAKMHRAVHTPQLDAPGRHRTHQVQTQKRQMVVNR